MKHSLTRIASRLCADPWLMRRDKFRSLLQQYSAATTDRGPAHLTLEMPEPDRLRIQQQADMDCLSCLDISQGIAIVPVVGILGKHLDFMDTMCGGYDLDVLIEQSIALMNRGDVETVLLHLKTPGGAAAGVADAGKVLLELGQQKRLVCYIDEACSGGQWLAAACTERYIGESAMCGSISAICAVLDESEWFKEQGFKMDVFTDGIHKSAGMEGTSLTPVQSAEIQRRIEYIGGEFKDFIRARCPGVTDETMQGQWFYGKEAIELGLVDAVAPSIFHVVAALAN